jgi:translocation and assembly module TamB
MSEIESTVPDSPEPVSQEPAPLKKRSRLRRFFLRHVPLTVAGALVLLMIAAVGLYFWASSAAFQGYIRRVLITKLEAATGGRVEIATFHWDLLDLEADAGGLVLHGLESPEEAPLARVDQMKVRFSVLGIVSPRILLTELEISRPALHFIVYPDGSTNQPQPPKKTSSGKSAIDTLFDLKAGRVAVKEGVLDYDNRAASFDLQNRFSSLDFDAKDVSLLLRYVPGGSASSLPHASGVLPAGSDESYHLEAGVADLNLSRGKALPVHGFMQATVDLKRNAVTLRSLRITSKTSDAKGHANKDRGNNQGNKEHTLEVSGALQDFAHPRWQARVNGELDMKMLDPIFGYPFESEGTATLDIDGSGEGGEFRADGSVHVDDGSYIGTGVVATGLRVDARVHADAKQLLVTSIVAHLRQGGQMEGVVDLSPWLPGPQPNIPTIEAMHSSANRNIPVWHPAPSTIAMNGKVTAQLKDVALDSLLDMLGQAPFQRLGLDTRMNGPAVATWSHGDVGTVAVNVTLNMSPSGQNVAGETAASGVVEATYTQRDGAVDVHTLEVHTPASELDAHGRLGVYPLTSPTALSVDFHSHDLNEFDAVLRDLGLNRYGKTGAAALPVSLGGQLDFLHGTWGGSLIAPRIAGSLKATQLSIEMLPVQTTVDAKAAHPQVEQPRLVKWDTVEASGSYAAERITIDHGMLQRGKAEIEVDGSLDAGASRTPTFDTNSALQMHLKANQVSVDDLLPFTGRSLPLSGTINAQVQVNGAINTLGGSGWVELDKGSVYGEPISRIRAQGTMANQVVKLASLTVNEAAGNVAATGSFDIKTRQFQIDTHGSGIDVSKIGWLSRAGVEATGKLGFQVTGSGTVEDPRVDARATLTSLMLGGEPVGTLDFVAHTANRSATYDATTRLETAELKLHGQTKLDGDRATLAKLEISQFNIGALFKMAHVESIHGESALAGTVTVAGPLAKPEDMAGEASLKELVVTVAGVRLESEGGLHATLANGRIDMDPLHVTGDQTDLHAKGSLNLRDKQQLDLAASGSINLKLAETLDPDLTASGTTTFQVEAHGPLKDPGLEGRIDFQNGALSLEDIPNGLSQLHGTLEFNRNRLEVKSLTAMSGGGLLSVGGYLAYQRGIFADLSVSGKGIRIRYPQGVSSLADATLRLQGSQNNLQLSGDVMITRFTVSQDLDITALAAQANTVQTIAPLDAPSNHIRMDVHIVSSPQLNFQNAYAKLAGDVDLRLRGTVASPSLRGRISITEGSATIAGTRYDLQRGEISFNNPVRIEPTIDLNATARVEDYDITLSLQGTPEKPSVSWRSDPPLPEADVVALLALGRTGNQERLYTQQQEQSVASPTTDALLGAALNATVSSRVQKLFGAGSVKVDPNYIGALGNSTSRIIVEEQVGRNLTLTYATDVDTTGQQLIQAEVAINRHVSLLVARDESGVFSMVVKATRRYR